MGIYSKGCVDDRAGEGNHMKTDNTCERCGRDTRYLFCVWCAVDISKCTENGLLLIWDEEGIWWV